MPDNHRYTEMMVSIINVEDTESNNDGEPIQYYPTTTTFMMEFETKQDALDFIDTSADPKGLVNVEMLTPFSSWKKGEPEWPA